MVVLAAIEEQNLAQVGLINPQATAVEQRVQTLVFLGAVGAEQFV